MGEKRKHSIRVTKYLPELRTRGDYMRYAREVRNLSTYTVSELSGVAQATICAWELDKVSPRLDCLELVADVLGLSLDEYVGHAIRKARTTG